MKKLTRSKNRIFAGVIGGLAEYFEIDPTILRVGFVLLMILTAVLPLVIFYIICIFIIPDPYKAQRQQEREEAHNHGSSSADSHNHQSYRSEQPQNHSTDIEVKPVELSDIDHNN